MRDLKITVIGDSISTGFLTDTKQGQKINLRILYYFKESIILLKKIIKNTLSQGFSYNHQKTISFLVKEGLLEPFNNRNMSYTVGLMYYSLPCKIKETLNYNSVKVNDLSLTGLSLADSISFDHYENVKNQDMIIFQLGSNDMIFNQEDSFDQNLKIVFDLLKKQNKNAFFIVLGTVNMASLIKAKDLDKTMLNIFGFDKIKSKHLLKISNMYHKIIEKSITNHNYDYYQKSFEHMEKSLRNEVNDLNQKDLRAVFIPLIPDQYYKNDFVNKNLTIDGMHPNIEVLKKLSIELWPSIEQFLLKIKERI